MRKIRCYNLTAKDPQHCLVEFDEVAKRIGLEENDVISVNIEFNEDDKIDQGNGRLGPSYTLYVYYFKSND